MKKEIMLSLAISVALVSSASSVLAAPSTETNQATVSNGVSFTQASPLEISGKITQISEGEMTVITEEGKSYKVPLWQFAKQTGFSDLGLVTGTEVTLKSTLPDLSNIKMGTVTTATPLKLNALNTTIIDSKSLIKATGSTLTLSAVNSSDLKKAIPTLSLVPNIAAKGTVDFKAIDIKDITALTPTPINGTITTLTAVPGVKLDLSKVQLGTLKVVEGTQGVIGTAVIPAGGSFTLSSLTEGELIFIAGEISANGKSLKLNK